MEPLRGCIGAHCGPLVTYGAAGGGGLFSHDSTLAKSVARNADPPPRLVDDIVHFRNTISTRQKKLCHKLAKRNRQLAGGEKSGAMGSFCHPIFQQLGDWPRLFGMNTVLSFVSVLCSSACNVMCTEIAKVTERSWPSERTQDGPPP